MLIVELYERGSWQPYRPANDKGTAKGHAQDALTFNGVSKTRILNEKGECLYEYTR